MRVRCLKLLKQYTRKGVADDDDDEEEDEESGTQGRGAFPSEGRIVEKDVLSQAYGLGMFYQSLLFSHTVSLRISVCLFCPQLAESTQTHNSMFHLAHHKLK